MTVNIEVLYAPTCANSLLSLKRVRKALADFENDVTIEEIDVTKHPEVLNKYPSPVWQDFLDGYIHYLTIVAVNGKALEHWYWDTGKIVEAVRRELEPEK